MGSKWVQKGVYKNDVLFLLWDHIKARPVCHFYTTNLAILCHITKEKGLSKYSRKVMTWRLVPGLFLFAKN